MTFRGLELIFTPHHNALGFAWRHYKLPGLIVLNLLLLELQIQLSPKAWAKVRP